MKSANVRILHPDQLYRIDAKEVEALVRSELADWLAFDWFYPEGFELARFTDTAEFYIASGKDFEYIFPKRKENASSLLAAFEKLQQLAQCSQALAPQWVIGLKHLQWREGELVWLDSTEHFPFSLPPKYVDELALVVCRVPDGGRLSDVLIDEGELSKTQLNSLTQSLISFHQGARQQSTGAYASSYLEQQVIRPLLEFLAANEPYLDLFSRLAFRDIQNYLNATLVSHELRFRQRSQDGYVSRVHGDLRAQHVIVQGLEAVEDSGQMPVLGRKAPLADVLSDVASLVVDFELYDAEYLSQELLSRYRQAAPDLFDEELFRFYKIAECARAAIDSYANSGVRASRALGRALREIYQLPEALVIVVCGSAVGEAQSLAETIAELFDIPFLEVEDIRLGAHQGILSEQSLFDRFAQFSDRLLAERGVLVSHWVGVDAALSRRTKDQMRSWLAESGRTYRIIECREHERLDCELAESGDARSAQIELAIQIIQGLATY